MNPLEKAYEKYCNSREMGVSHKDALRQVDIENVVREQYDGISDIVSSGTGSIVMELFSKNTAYSFLYRYEYNKAIDENKFCLVVQMPSGAVVVMRNPNNGKNSVDVFTSVSDDMVVNPYSIIGALIEAGWKVDPASIFDVYGDVNTSIAVSMENGRRIKHIVGNGAYRDQDAIDAFLSQLVGESQGDSPSNNDDIGSIVIAEIEALSDVLSIDDVRKPSEVAYDNSVARFFARNIFIVLNASVYGETE